MLVKARVQRPPLCSLNAVESKRTRTFGHVLDMTAAAQHYLECYHRKLPPGIEPE